MQMRNSVDFSSFQISRCSSMISQSLQSELRLLVFNYPVHKLAFKTWKTLFYTCFNVFCVPVKRAQWKSGGYNQHGNRRPTCGLSELDGRASGEFDYRLSPLYDFSQSGWQRNCKKVASVLQRNCNPLDSHGFTQ